MAASEIGGEAVENEGDAPYQPSGEDSESEGVLDIGHDHARQGGVHADERAAEEEQDDAGHPGLAQPGFRWMRRSRSGGITRLAGCLTLLVVSLDHDASQQSYGAHR